MTTKHILIVDDEPRVAFFLSKTLEHSDRNYRVSVANSGEEALEMLDDSSVDLLVTDLRMPGISGLELLNWVRAFSPQTRTILITAYGDDEIEADSRRLEAYRYITKPFDIGDFARVVQEALRDMAISRPGIVVLSDEIFETITQQLENLRYDIGALCIFLADMQGQRLAETGDTTGLDVSTLLSLLAGGFAASGELAHQFGSGKAVNLNFHEGSRYDIYSASVGDNLFLAIIYNRRVKASRIGIVWLYTRRAVEGLLSTLSVAAVTAPAQALDTDFGPSRMVELDTPVPGPPPRVEENDSGATDGGQVSPAKPEVESPGGPPPGEAAEGKYFDGDEPEQELLNMEAAIARGLIPRDLGMEHNNNQ